MPINKREGESRDEFISRCISIEIEAGKGQEQAVAICITKADEEFASATQSVSDATWSTEAPINVNLKSYRDYPKAASENAKVALRWAEENGWGSCGTPVGKARANQLANGEPISEETISRMASFERHRQSSQRELGEGCGRLMWLAWGGDEGIEWAQRKLRQIENEQSFASQKRVIFNEDFDVDKVKELKAEGFKVYIRSSRKIKKKDKKVWNKLQNAGLNDDALVFGEVKDLHKRYNFNLFMTGSDPISEALSVLGRPYVPSKIIHEEFVNSIEDAKEKQELALKNVNLKFIRVISEYKYEERPGVAPAASGSRDFCKKRLAENRVYTLSEIDQLSNAHLVKQFANYGIDPDVFLYRGGWYREPGEDGTITPFCRHQWKLIVRIEP